MRNLEIALRLRGAIIPFVGLHPEILAIGGKSLTEAGLETEVGRLSELLSRAQGLGEIGLDPKYGKERMQKMLFESQLELAERHPDLPVCIHSRDSSQKVIEILSTYHLQNEILFHWFSGSTSELQKLQSRGCYVSFGPALIFSKRLQRLSTEADQSSILPETDSPLVLQSLVGASFISPFAVTSVIFKFSELLHSQFSDTMLLMEENTNRYLRAQNSLRV
jgi:TatD DNase family protein